MLIFARLFPNRKVFCICFSSSRKEFGIDVSNAKYTILEIAGVTVTEWTVNCIVKIIFHQIGKLLCLFSRVLHFNLFLFIELHTALYRKNCKKSFV